MSPRALIATFLATWVGASCVRGREQASLDAQAVAVVPTASAEGGDPAALPTPSATDSNASIPVDAGPCTPTTLTSSARLVSDIHGCDGSCPVYRVALHGDGTVEYDGTDAKITGHRRTRIAPKATEALFAQAECGTFAVPRSRPRGVGSGMAGPAEVDVTLDLGNGPRTLRAHRSRACGIGEEAQDRAICELSYAIDEAVHVETWVGYLPRSGPRVLAHDP
jgi:hypothetical protein